MFILIVIVALVAAFLIYAANRPDSFSTRRETVIGAPPEKIFPLIQDFHRWASWSPYEKRDPNMTKTFSGAAAGKGAVYEWSGNAAAGAGRMEILEADAPTKVVVDLHMLKPFEGRPQVVFALEPEAAGTRVSWAMSGKTVFFSKVMGIFMNMDKMIGTDFEVGLASLKALAEG